MRLSLVIPLYRDVQSLPAIFERCAPILDQHGPGELVLVDDGGLDGTTAEATRLAAGYRHAVTVVRLARNFGQHPAVFAGLAHATGDVVVTLDSDLQYPPEDIPRLLAELKPGVTVVSGYRADRRDPLLRRGISAVLTRYLNRRVGTRLHDFGSMFRAYDREVVDAMLQFTERHRYVPAVVAWLGVPIVEVPVTHESRSERGSRYRMTTLLDLFMDLVTGYSIFPLRLLTGLGIVAALVGLISTAAFAVYRVTEGTGVSGTVSAFAVLFALAAVQLLILATLGEYVGRIYTEAKGRPYYVVAEVRNEEAGALSTRLLPWDTEHFGFRIGIADDPTATDDLDLRCCYLQVDTADVDHLAVAQAHGFEVVDVRVELEGPLERSEPEGIELVDDDPALRQLARTRLRGGRFHADPRFGPAKAEALYERWLERSWREPDRFVVATPARDGFLAGHVDLPTGRGSIELVAVEEGSTGAGIGAALVRAAGSAFVERGMSTTAVATQASNIAALRLYEGAGYRVTRTAYWLHRWSD